MPDYRAMAVAAAQAAGINPAIFVQQMRQESGLQPGKTSSAGARGIAQFMPATARSLGINPDNPRQALNAAAHMDAANLHKYGNWRDTLSLYNSGRGWSQGQHIGQTNNYVRSILGAAGGGSASVRGSQAAFSPASPQTGAQSATGGFGNALASYLLESASSLAAGHAPDASGLLNLALSRQDMQQPSAPAQQLAGQVQGMSSAGTGTGKINELFYDPLGAIKNGQRIAPIGGHSDHVHVALGSLGQQLAAENQARRMGLHVGEEQNSDFHNVHVSDSYHNRNFKGTKYRQAADVSGTPARMAAFFRWVQRNR